MASKKTIIFVAITAAALLLVGIVALFLKGAFNPNDPYYEKLRQGCQGNSCCLASVKAMGQGQYFEALNGSCENGFVRNQLMCLQSLKWCERQKELPETEAKAACTETGGTWMTLPNPCEHRCDYRGEACIQVIEDGCQCGAKRCWDGIKCRQK